MGTDTAQMIKKAGTPVKGSGRKGTAVYEVFCCVCGGKIQSDNVRDIGFV